MNGRILVSTVSHFLHAHFLWFLLGSYAAAVLWPAFGLWIRDVSVGEVAFLGERSRVTLPMLMLALLLVNAGLGVKASRLRNLVRSAPLLGVGLIANLLIPIAFIFGVSQIMRAWREPDEVQNLLVGLALVASMPIAGSSTAWSQNNNGSMAMSLGLVLLSTLLSPLTTPAALHSVGLMASGSYAATLHQLAAQGAGLFLAACVVLPAFLGVLGRMVIGGTRIDGAKPQLKLVNCLNLLLLNYSNGSVSLPSIFARPDWDFLGVTLGFAVGLCVLAFASGWWIARLLRAEPEQRIALMFGLGMNNNGTGLVLASLALPHLPQVMLPIIFYNLVQHLVAGGVTAFLVRRPAFGEGEAAHHVGEPCRTPRRGESVLRVLSRYLAMHAPRRGGQ
jgi:BASS family bile acid:Na+ symporter